jgi:hypothetical protein
MMRKYESGMVEQCVVRDYQSDGFDVSLWPVEENQESFYYSVNRVDSR